MFALLRSLNLYIPALASWVEDHHPSSISTGIPAQGTSKISNLQNASAYTPSFWIRPWTGLHRINGANFQTGDGFPPSPKPWPEVLLLTAKEKSPEHHKTCFRGMKRHQFPRFTREWMRTKTQHRICIWLYLYKNIYKRVSANCQV